MKHCFTHEECVRGGIARSQQESFRELQRRRGQNGFWKTMETHPYFARKHLKAKLKGRKSDD